MIKDKLIILGNDHTNSLGIAQCMGRAGYEIVSFVWGVKSGLLRHSRYVKQIYSANSAKGCVEMMLEIFDDENEKIPVIACCDMAALTLEAYKEKLKEYFLFEYSTNFTLDYLAVKGHQVKLAQDAGFKVPKSWVLKNRTELQEDIVYPCLIKPLVSCQGAKSDIRVCKNEAELKANLDSLEYTERVILQQYIERDYEISILGCGTKKGITVIPCVENKLTLYPKNVGLECLANIQPLEDETIISPIRELIQRIGYVGMFSVEMMHSKIDGKFYFTEINLRNDGANSFIVKFGVNLPLLHVMDLKDGELPTFTAFHPGYYIWEKHHFSSLLHKDISFWQWMKEIRMSKGFLTYFKEDKMPFYWQFISPYLRKLHLTEGGCY